MREFSFLRADTALPRLLNKEDFADVEQIYLRVNTALASHSPVASYLGRYFKKYARMTTIEYRRKPGLNDAVITAVNKEMTTEILII